MLIFIDESGDSGMKFKEGSSEYFVICAVIFMEQDAADVCDLRVIELRRELRLHPEYEFHFNKCERRIREAFLSGLLRQRFKYTALILNKKKLYGPGFQHKRSFYKYPVRLACENLAVYLDDATIVLDRCGERKFTKEVEKYLKKQLNRKNPGCIKRVKSDRSHNNNLIQVADMICGGVARSYRKDKTDRHTYRTILRGKEINVQLWPK